MKSSFKAEYPSVINKLYSGEATKPKSKSPTLGELTGINSQKVPEPVAFTGLSNFNFENTELLEKLQPADLTPSVKISVKNYSDAGNGRINVKTMTDSDIEATLPPPAPPLVIKAYRAQEPQLPEAKRPIENIIKEAARNNGVDEQLAMAVARAESSLRTDVVSKDGFESKGLFQLLDSTAKDLAPELFEENNYDPFNPEVNSELGNKYLKQLSTLFGGNNYLTRGLSTFSAISEEDREKFAVAAFNAGQGRVAEAQAKALTEGGNPGRFQDIIDYLPKITQNYVSRVQRFKEEEKLASTVQHRG